MVPSLLFCSVWLHLFDKKRSLPDGHSALFNHHPILPVFGNRHSLQDDNDVNQVQRALELHWPNKLDQGFSGIRLLDCDTNVASSPPAGESGEYAQSRMNCRELPRVNLIEGAPDCGLVRDLIPYHIVTDHQGNALNERDVLSHLLSRLKAHFFLDHLEAAALAAISLRRSAVSDAARARPPFSPPRLPKATAKAFLPSAVLGA
jgi:hypothetical protein